MRTVETWWVRAGLLAIVVSLQDLGITRPYFNHYGIRSRASSTNLASQRSKR